MINEKKDITLCKRCSSFKEDELKLGWDWCNFLRMSFLIIDEPCDWLVEQIEERKHTRIPHE
ncbi:MAG: hypothetical protein LBV68_04395 [Spirochaetaceae bacterium]|jgi:hypothetical protein|nr:hypothetical protein [Spirochaetaceae bacterium]